MTGALAGIRIVEFGAIGPVPFAGMLLADMGADIVRVERPGAVSMAPALDRGRRVVAADLKAPESREAVLDLLAGADALMEGFRPGVMERLGLGPDAALARNPRLVYGRMTGWGQTGPLAGAAGHDLNYVALSGALAAIGAAGGPPVPPLNLVGDYGGGALYLVAGLLAGLLSARATGRGQVVDCAMAEGAASLMSMFYDFHGRGAWRPERGANLLDGGAPFYGIYACADGLSIALAPLEPQFFAALAAALGLTPEEEAGRDDPARWPALRARIAAIVATLPREEWCRRLEGTDVCFAPVLTMAEAPRHPHAVARGSFLDVDGVTQPAPAPRFLGTPSAVRPSRAEPSLAAAVAGWAGAARGQD